MYSFHFFLLYYVLTTSRYPSKQLTVTSTTTFIANVTLDWTAAYFADSQFNDPAPDLAIDHSNIVIVNPFIKNFLLLVPITNNGQVTAHSAQVQVFLNPFDANASNYSTLANITQYVLLLNCFFIVVTFMFSKTETMKVCPLHKQGLETFRHCRRHQCMLQ